MKTKLILTNDNVIVNTGESQESLENDKFYSNRGKHFKHIDMREVNKMFPEANFTIKNDKDKMVTIEAMIDGKNKLTQINPGQRLSLS